MSPFLQLATLIIIILVAAKSAGYLATKLGQPTVLGELIVGLVLGPSVLDIAHLGIMSDPHLTITIIELGEMGVLLLMFLAGMELHINELAGQLKVSAFAGILGVLAPVFLGWLTGILFHLDNSSALFLGLTMGATSVSISAQTLMEIKQLRSRVGLGMLGAAVFDDVLVIILLSIFLAVQSGGDNITSIVLIFAKILVFLGLSVGIGIWLLPKLAHRVQKLSITQGVLTLAVVVMLLYGIGAELIGGMAAITGTFIAGLMFSRSPEKSRLESGLLALGYGFFVPIFFISIGLSINLRGLNISVLWLMLVVTGFAVIGKLVGAGLGAKIAGFSNRESLQLGAGMISRGEVGLIVAAVGLNQNLVNATQFSAVVGMVVITTIITPPFLRVLFKEKTSIAAPDIQTG